MKIKLILLFVILLFIEKTIAQKEKNHSGVYTEISYEFGFLSSYLQETDIPFTKNVIHRNSNNSMAIKGIYKTLFNTEVRLGYMISYSSLKINGDNNNNFFSVNNNYFTHTFAIGAGYSFEIKNNLDISIGVGSSLTFVNNLNLIEAKGVDTDLIKATNESEKKGNVYLVPELSITKHLEKGNSLVFGIKFYQSANHRFLRGSIENINNKTVVKRVTFTTQNNQFALYLSYRFSLSKP